MSSSVPLTESMGWKLCSYLEQFPNHYDVAFSVGPEKVVVKALSVILRSSSPVFEQEFKDRWGEAVVRKGEGIPLPDFDPVAFKLFLKLMILDTWSVEALNDLKLPLNQLLHLLEICRKYEMTIAVQSLAKLVKEFLKNFHNYVDKKDSLLLSHSQLEVVLASNELFMNEMDVFNYACRWAEEQCRKQELEVTGINLRLVLGDALYEIRFPLMTIKDFAPVMQRKGLLSFEEVTEIVQFIGMGGYPNTSIDNKEPQFRVETRNKPKFTSVPAGNSRVSVTQVFPVVDTPFVCDGYNQEINFNMDTEMLLCGLGFAGPIEADSFYDVTVEILRCPGGIIRKKMKKRIYAQKANTFYFIFDHPLALGLISYNRWRDFYSIDYTLKGPNTRSLQFEDGATKRIKDGSKEFVIQWHAPQLVEIVYNNV